MRNVFFDIALNRAARLSGKAGRILLLLTKLGKKMLTVNWSTVKVATAKDKFLIFSRLGRAYASGQYKALPWKSVMTMLAAIIYFINPVDLIPDFIPGMGLTDDFGVLMWVYSTLSDEINKFLEWENSMIQPK